MCRVAPPRASGGRTAPQDAFPPRERWAKRSRRTWTTERHSARGDGRTSDPSGSTRAACSAASRSTAGAASAPTSARSRRRSTPRRRPGASACWSSAAPTCCRASPRRGWSRCRGRAARGGRLATQLHQQVQLAAWLSARRPAAVHFPAQTDAPGPARGALDRDGARRRPAPSRRLVRVRARRRHARRPRGASALPHHAHARAARDRARVADHRAVARDGARGRADARRAAREADDHPARGGGPFQRGGSTG